MKAAFCCVCLAQISLQLLGTEVVQLFAGSRILEEGRNASGELRVKPHSPEQFASGLISELLNLHQHLCPKPHVF